MAIQTSFAKKVTGPQHCNDRFLALLGNDAELDIVFPSPTLARNSLGSNEALTLFLTKAPLFLLATAALSPDEGRARRGDYSDSTAQMKIRLVRTVRERSSVPFVSAVGNWGNGTPSGILPSHNQRKCPNPLTCSNLPPFISQSLIRFGRIFEGPPL